MQRKPYTVYRARRARQKPHIGLNEAAGAVGFEVGAFTDADSEDAAGGAVAAAVDTFALLEIVRACDTMSAAKKINAAVAALDDKGWRCSWS